MRYSFFTLLLLSVFSLANAQRVTPDTLPLKKGTLIIQPIQHASLLLLSNGTTIYVDPVGGAAKYSNLPSPDMILVTDIHGDHFDSATIAAIQTPKTILVVPQAVADKLPSFDKSRLVVLHNGDNSAQAGIKISAIPMYNLPISSDARHPKGRGNGYVLNIGGKNVYLSGDTQGVPEMRALKNIEVAFVCMNLPYTMDVNEASNAVLAFAPKIVYPYHYRGQDPNQFKALVNAGNKGIEVRVRDWYVK